MTLSIEDAAQELQSILARAAGAADASARVDVQQSLNDFSRALPYLPEFGALRRAADETFDDLSRHVAEDVQGAIRRRGDRLAEQVREIEAATDRAAAGARAAQTKIVDRVVSAAEQIAAGLTALEGAIRANDLTAAADKLEPAWAAVRALRSEVADPA